MREWLPFFLLLALAVLFFLLGRGKRRQTGLPEARVVYADDRQFQRLSQPLLDDGLGLVGKPDYILGLKGGMVIPVEVKSSRAPSRPYETHLVQLAAYCHLVESAYGARPSYGLLRYADKTFEIPYDAAMKALLLETIQRLRVVENSPEAPTRNHQQPARCQGCGFADSCDQKM